jgi:hypothetical protein
VIGHNGGLIMFIGADVYNNLELARLREERLHRLACDAAAVRQAAEQGERHRRWWPLRWAMPLRPTAGAATVRAEVIGPIKP